ncbi:exodeoxyribonuclease I subunit D [Mobilisporobacter senegalensis]|uniref:Nuclease SbcCD subunit D n=1 Tax=Mobilisporobacter senegalensis TaxID=1329262 RepID=A0A3N1XYM0_9FIRM|nr:exonuclease SbcCD subunit D [Mobilisporobacter senegalensis]ROR31388.1 exodeoxyribonuclease I subunit D [Mobilisporobacter senegalensis]
MKLIHTSDLHIGKVINEFSMLKDQEYALKQIARIAKEEKADGLIIAGDVYDRNIPPSEAVAIFDQFVSELIKEGIPILLISGNHDSPERLSFASSILEKKNFYIAGVFDGTVKCASFHDEYGEINIYLVPYLKPPVVKHILEKEEMVSYEDSVRAILNTIDLNKSKRNLLVTHYFVTNLGEEPELSDSETRISVGGTDNIDVSLFDGFDYVALGHIHGPQKIGRDTVRYAGSPLKYSFSEVFHKKSVTVIELKEKGNVELRTREIKPLHDLRKVKGKLEELMSKEVYSMADTGDYLQVTLTNQEELIDPIGTLRSVYPNVMQLILEKNIKKNDMITTKTEHIKNKSTLEIYREFYESVTEQEFDEERKAVMTSLIDDIEGGGLL